MRRDHSIVDPYNLQIHIQGRSFLYQTIAGISVGHSIIFFYDISSDRHKAPRNFSILMVNIAKCNQNSKKYSSSIEKGAISCV